MKVKLPNSDVVCPKCHVHLEVEDSDLKFKNDMLSTCEFHFRKGEILRTVKQSSYLQGNSKMREQVIEELTNISQLAREARIFTEYGGDDYEDTRVYVLCPICGEEINIISPTSNTLKLTVGGDTDDLEGDEYMHVKKVYGGFTIYLEYGREHTELTKKLKGYGYKEVKYRM